MVININDKNDCGHLLALIVLTSDRVENLIKTSTQSQKMGKSQVTVNKHVFSYIRCEKRLTFMSRFI